MFVSGDAIIAVHCRVLMSAGCRHVSDNFGLYQSVSSLRLACIELIIMILMQNAQKPTRILIVDDDPAMRELLTEYLSSSGFGTEAVGDGVQLRKAIATGMPDAVLLDLMLPGEDGFELAREIRRYSTVPILMLSARGEEIDRVVGLEIGADDYMHKPFSPRELVARLRALIRRSRYLAPVAPTSKNTGVSFGTFTLDTEAHRLLQNNVEQHLTTAEFNLLRIFVERPNRVLSRDTIIDLLKGYDRDPFDRSVDIGVNRLRRKIEVDPTNPGFIRTVRGEGYLFNPRGHEV